MKTFLISILLFLFTSPVLYSQSGWVQQSSGTTGNLNKIFFINSSTGWIAGDSGIILNTTNGGSVWQRQISNTNKTLHSIAFKNKDTGWAAGGIRDNNPLCQDLIIILKTTNGGTNWVAIQGGYGFTFFDIFHTDTSLYICSYGLDFSCMSIAGGIQKSTNNGLTWNYLNTIVPSGFKSMYFLNSNTGWAAGFWSTDVPPSIFRIFKTTNAGTNWEITFSDSTPVTGGYFFYPCKKILFTNQYTGFATTESSIGSALIKSTDGGFNWNSLDSIETRRIISMDFISSDTGWGVGNLGKIIRTDNGGQNWSAQQSHTGYYLTSVDFINSETGWIVGSNGVILKTVTGGITSVSNNSSEIPSGYILNQNYPNPFNPVTKIKFEIPEEGLTEIIIYDMLGKEVQTLINRNLEAGRHEVTFDGSNVVSGIYFYKITSGNFSQLKKMVLIR